MLEVDSVEEAVDDIKRGRIVVVVDDESRENEGDLVCAAAQVTPELIAFMAAHGRGLVCAPIAASIADHLRLSAMVPHNTETTGCNFLISIDAGPELGATTGISARDRAITIRHMMNPTAKPNDFRRPGHVFPLLARSGGVLERNGHTEAAVELAILAGLPPAGVICEIMLENGTMARRGDLSEFALRYGLTVITIEQLQRHMRAYGVRASEQGELADRPSPVLSRF